MEVTTRKAVANYEGRDVHFVELEVLGDRHTLSVRKYPKNISVKMWKNSDKSGTTVSLKMPHGMFDFLVDVSTLLDNFDTELDNHMMMELEARWDRAVAADDDF